MPDFSTSSSEDFEEVGSPPPSSFRRKETTTRRSRSRSTSRRQTDFKQIRSRSNSKLSSKDTKNRRSRSRSSPKETKNRRSRSRSTSKVSPKESKRRRSRSRSTSKVSPKESKRRRSRSRSTSRSRYIQRQNTSKRIQSRSRSTSRTANRQRETNNTVQSNSRSRSRSGSRCNSEARSKSRSPQKFSKKRTSSLSPSSRSKESRRKNQKKNKRRSPSTSSTASSAAASSSSSAVSHSKRRSTKLSKKHKQSKSHKRTKSFSSEDERKINLHTDTATTSEKTSKSFGIDKLTNESKIQKEDCDVINEHDPVPINTLQDLKNTVIPSTVFKNNFSTDVFPIDLIEESHQLSNVQQKNKFKQPIQHIEKNSLENSENTSKKQRISHYENKKQDNESGDTNILKTKYFQNEANEKRPLEINSNSKISTPIQTTNNDNITKRVDNHQSKPSISSTTATTIPSGQKPHSAATTATQTLNEKDSQRPLYVNLISTRDDKISRNQTKIFPLAVQSTCVCTTAKCQFIVMHTCTKSFANNFKLFLRDGIEEAKNSGFAPGTLITTDWTIKPREVYICPYCNIQITHNRCHFKSKRVCTSNYYQVQSQQSHIVCQYCKHTTVYTSAVDNPCPGFKADCELKSTDNSQLCKCGCLAVHHHCLRNTRKL